MVYTYKDMLAKAFISGEQYTDEKSLILNVLSLVGKLSYATFKDNKEFFFTK